MRALKSEINISEGLCFPQVIKYFKSVNTVSLVKISINHDGGSKHIPFMVMSRPNYCVTIRACSQSFKLVRVCVHLLTGIVNASILAS